MMRTLYNFGILTSAIKGNKGIKMDRNRETCAVYSIQTRLNELGYDAGVADNEEGPNTHAAISRFKRQVGLNPRPYLGPRSLGILFRESTPRYSPDTQRPTVPDTDYPSAPWLGYALQFDGLKEIPGSRHNDQIVEWGQQSGITWWNNDDDAWCAVFVNGCLVNAGYPSTKSALARSFSGYAGEFEGVGYGKELDPSDTLPPGTIIVMPRGRMPFGHVAIVIEDLGNSVATINGNVSNMVKRSTYKKSDILSNGARWPTPDMRGGLT